MFVNIFSLYGYKRDKYTESGTGGQIVRKRDCPAESRTVGMYVITKSNRIRDEEQTTKKSK